MRAVDIIQKKRDNLPLTKDEIIYLLNSYTSGDVPDYQMSAFCMAVYFNGMNEDELAVFTECMKNSGDTIEFEGLNRFLIDKHSTGGVGDKTTLALSPLLAAFGIGTAKLSGRGLGHTGGTIDKFESIPGFTFPEDRKTLIDLVNKTGMGIMGYSDTIVPLDKKLYSLRDVTATVPSIPLIASSIMSKKLAVHADGIILDVKCGSGAFMKNYSDAKILAETMLSIGKKTGRNIVAVLSNMDQPLGNAVGNTLEVIEALETIKGNGPEDFSLLVETLAGIALMLKGEVSSSEEGIAKIKEVIQSGKALNYFADFIEACGGDRNIVSDYSIMPVAPNVFNYTASESGYIHSIEAEMIGQAAMVLGAGREKKGDDINHGVGIVFEKKIGAEIKKDDVICKLYYDSDSKLQSAKKILENAIKIDTPSHDSPDIIYSIIK
jgi:pyrimidine-nucleoside phosphorylase